MWRVVYDAGEEQTFDNSALASFFIHKRMTEYTDIHATHVASGRVVMFRGQVPRRAWVLRRLDAPEPEDL